METSFKNPILESYDLDLIFDLPNIKNETFGEILEIIKYCSSLVNTDIIYIAEELTYRMQEKLIQPSLRNVKMIQNLYSLIKRIPNTYDLQCRIKVIYGDMVQSPISSPVSPPPIPKKMKKSKSYLRKKMCPC